MGVSFSKAFLACLEDVMVGCTHGSETLGAVVRIGEGTETVSAFRLESCAERVALMAFLRTDASDISWNLDAGVPEIAAGSPDNWDKVAFWFPLVHRKPPPTEMWRYHEFFDGRFAQLHKKVHENIRERYAARRPVPVYLGSCGKYDVAPISTSRCMTYEVARVVAESFLLECHKKFEQVSGLEQDRRHTDFSRASNEAHFAIIVHLLPHMHSQMRKCGLERYGRTCTEALIRVAEAERDAHKIMNAVRGIKVQKVDGKGGDAEVKVRPRDSSLLQHDVVKASFSDEGFAIEADIDASALEGRANRKDAFANFKKAVAKAVSDAYDNRGQEYLHAVVVAPVIARTVWEACRPILYPAAPEPASSGAAPGSGPVSEEEKASTPLP